MKKLGGLAGLKWVNKDHWHHSNTSLVTLTVSPENVTSTPCSTAPECQSDIKPTAGKVAIQTSEYAIESVLIDIL